MDFQIEEIEAEQQEQPMIERFMAMLEQAEQLCEKTEGDVALTNDQVLMLLIAGELNECAEQLDSIYQVLESFNC